MPPAKLGGYSRSRFGLSTDAFSSKARFSPCCGIASNGGVFGATRRGDSRTRGQAIGELLGRRLASVASRKGRPAEAPASPVLWSRGASGVMEFPEFAAPELCVVLVPSPALQLPNEGARHAAQKLPWTAPESAAPCGHAALDPAPTAACRRCCTHSPPQGHSVARQIMPPGPRNLFRDEGPSDRRKRGRAP